MVDVSYVVVLAVVVSFLALFVVIIMLIRTTRKVVDNTNMLLKIDADTPDFSDNIQIPAGGKPFRV